LSPAAAAAAAAPCAEVGRRRCWPRARAAGAARAASARSATRAPLAMVDLAGYVIILVETPDKKFKLYGESFNPGQGNNIFLQPTGSSSRHFANIYSETEILT